MLTIKQLVVIETRSSALPLRVGGLRNKYGQGRLSLRSIIRQVEAKKATFFVQVRDPTILNAVTSLEQVQAAWKKSTPSKATLAHLSQILSSRGASIVYLSRDWQTAGIAGTTGSLASVPVETYNFETGMTKIGEGIIAAISITISTLGAVSTVGLPMVVLGVTGNIVAGAFAGWGLMQILSTPSDPTPPPIEIIEFPDEIVYGQPPPDVPEGNVITLPPIDITAIPEVPPEPIPEPPSEPIPKPPPE